MRTRELRPPVRIRSRPLRRRRRWPLRRPARRIYRLATVPGAVTVAMLTSGSWCNPLDWQGFVEGIVEGMGEALVWLLNLAFNNPLTVVSAAEWQAAFGQAARWGGVFAVVAVAMCAVEIVAGVIAADHGRILRGWVWAILAWPLTAASLLVFSRLVNASDWLTTAILDSIQAPEVVTRAVAVTGATSAVTTALVGMLLGVSALSTWWLALIFVGLALLPVIGLVIVLGAVTFGQIALAGFAPVALMLAGFRGTRAMASKWLQMAVALLLTKPIAAGIIALGCAVGAQGGADGLILGIIAVTVAMGSPALAFSFVGFAGAQLGGALTAHADKVKGLAGSVAYAGANQGVAALRDRLAGAANAAAATVGAGTASAASAGKDAKNWATSGPVSGAGKFSGKSSLGASNPMTAAGRGTRTAAAGRGTDTPDSGAQRSVPTQGGGEAAGSLAGDEHRFGEGTGSADPASADLDGSDAPWMDGAGGDFDGWRGAAEGPPAVDATWLIDAGPRSEASGPGRADAARLAGPTRDSNPGPVPAAQGGEGVAPADAAASSDARSTTSGGDVAFGGGQSGRRTTAGSAAAPTSSMAAGEASGPVPSLPNRSAGSPAGAAPVSPASMTPASQAPTVEPERPKSRNMTPTAAPAPPGDGQSEPGPNPFGGA